MSRMEPFLGLSKQVWKFFLPVFAVTLLVGFLVSWLIALLPAGLGLYILWFFRDPERKTPGIPNSITSPADGKIASVLEVPCEEMPGGRALRVAVFLNVFNVHVQRAPIAGRVFKREVRAGQCMNALNEKCSEVNEAVTIWLDSEFGPIGVRQLSGAIARRIICAAKEGDSLERGERYGIIQFASRVEVFLPLTASVKVQPGQKVVGGETCVAVLFEDQVRKGLSKEKLAKIALPAQAAG